MDNTIYRRNKFIIGSNWHCNPQCPHWPRNDYFETTFFDPNRGDHLCADCTRYADNPAGKSADKRPHNAA